MDLQTLFRDLKVSPDIASRVSATVGKTSLSYVTSVLRDATESSGISVLPNRQLMFPDRSRNMKIVQLSDVPQTSAAEYVISVVGEEEYMRDPKIAYWNCIIKTCNDNPRNLVKLLMTPIDEANNLVPQKQLDGSIQTNAAVVTLSDHPGQNATHMSTVSTQLVPNLLTFMAIDLLKTQINSDRLLTWIAPVTKLPPQWGGNMPSNNIYATQTLIFVAIDAPETPEGTMPDVIGTEIESTEFDVVRTAAGAEVDLSLLQSADGAAIMSMMIDAVVASLYNAKVSAAAACVFLGPARELMLRAETEPQFPRSTLFEHVQFLGSIHGILTNPSPSKFNILSAAAQREARRLKLTGEIENYIVPREALTLLDLGDLDYYRTGIPPASIDATEKTEVVKNHLPLTAVLPVKISRHSSIDYSRIIETDATMYTTNEISQNESHYESTETDCWMFNESGIASNISIPWIIATQTMLFMDHPNDGFINDNRNYYSYGNVPDPKNDYVYWYHLDGGPSCKLIGELPMKYSDEYLKKDNTLPRSIIDNKRLIAMFNKICSSDALKNYGKYTDEYFKEIQISFDTKTNNQLRLYGQLQIDGTDEQEQEQEQDNDPDDITKSGLKNITLNVLYLYIKQDRNISDAIRIMVAGFYNEHDIEHKEAIIDFASNRIIDRITSTHLSSENKFKILVVSFIKLTKQTILAFYENDIQQPVTFGSLFVCTAYLAHTITAATSNAFKSYDIQEAKLIVKDIVAKMSIAGYQRGNTVIQPRSAIALPGVIYSKILFGRSLEEMNPTNNSECRHGVAFVLLPPGMRPAIRPICDIWDQQQQVSLLYKQRPGEPELTSPTASFLETCYEFIDYKSGSDEWTYAVDEHEYAYRSPEFYTIGHSWTYVNNKFRAKIGTEPYPEEVMLDATNFANFFAGTPYKSISIKK